MIPAERPANSDFSTVIDNPFLTLRPGTTFHLENTEGGETIDVVVTHRTTVVDGVECVIVRDTEYLNGLITEDTYDWFAQDSASNVWYFGEDTAEYEPGEDEPESTDGSFRAGEDGAEAGIVMLGDPEVGDRYFNELAPDVAEDFSVVRSLESSASVRYGTFDEVLRTRDVNPLDPSSETKFYGEGIGFLLALDEDGEREELTGITVRGRGGDDDLLGYAGGDRMIGRGGDDRMNGLDGNDTIRGGGGDDVLKGGAGFDRLNAGSGNDTLRGGADGDTFVIRGLTDGVADTDTIEQYRYGQLDVIDLPNGADSVVSERDAGDHWALTLAGDGDVLRLTGVTDAGGDGSILDDVFIL